jgi:putative acetyltransferase
MGEEDPAVTTTPSLSIRHIRAEDAPALQALYAQPHAYRDTLQLPWPSEQRWQQKVLPAEHSYSLVACREERVLGQISLKLMTSPRRRHVATIGMAVDEQSRRQGVGDALLTAALELAERWIAVRRVELEVFADVLLMARVRV